MGVHGLTSYIDGNQQFFTDLKLRNSHLVIDGCSLYFRLYFTSGLDQARGGDYDAFALLVRRFFSALSSCGISAFVVLDGGMDESDKKFKTLRERAQSKINEAHSLSLGYHGSVLPLLTREVFRQVLCELGVPLVQCISEADFEIASLAHHWSCPVLTSDSDFYIFDLCAGYLPMTFFEWENVCGMASQRYIPARRFTVNRFCSHFNHMNKQLLPLFAVITGNDYTQAKTTEMFFSRVDLPMVPRRRGSPSNPRIEGFLRWLSAFRSPVEALEEVLEILGSKQKASLRKQLTAGIKDYQLPQTSSLAQFFSNPQLRTRDFLRLPAALMPQPDWLLKQITSGSLPPLVLDVLVLRRAFLIAQVENSRLPSSHEASLNIRKTIYGLLLQTGRGVSEQARSSNAQCFVEEYDRLVLNLRRTPVEVQLPAVGHPQLSLNTLDQAAENVRREVLLRTMGVMDHVLQLVEPHLHLPVCVTHFWMCSSTPKPSPSLLQGVLLGVVYGELCRRLASPGDPLHTCPSTTLVCQRLDQLRSSSSQRRSIDLRVAHSLSQWQSCLWAGVYLNQLLRFPLHEPRCPWLFSGTLLHGLESVLKGGHQAESLLAGAPVAMQLYSTMLGAVQGFGLRDQAAHHSAVQRGRGRRQRGTPGRGRRSGRRGGVSPAGDLSNRFWQLNCESDD
ncbi:protein asteroid homolog 1 [Silurus meridionalis]|uniref:protein asteroid homolog 1 n=1 Tax=Silurus meridionalis TaxID=175797 RepID=UPI001EE9C969|nr:protein asteroid homolog 1 [Silurus meridionalis]XP_046690441.1 protein asteroid homolog 1 [Silurus meridionalis]KAI5091130.1 protein asteroid-like 1 [Silurus meridionalis]